MNNALSKIVIRFYNNNYKRNHTPDLFRDIRTDTSQFSIAEQIPGRIHAKKERRVGFSSKLFPTADKVEVLC